MIEKNIYIYKEKKRKKERNEKKMKKKIKDMKING